MGPPPQCSSQIGNLGVDCNLFIGLYTVSLWPVLDVPHRMAGAQQCSLVVAFAIAVDWGP